MKRSEQLRKMLAGIQDSRTSMSQYAKELNASWGCDWQTDYRYEMNSMAQEVEDLDEDECLIYLELEKIKSGELEDFEVVKKVYDPRIPGTFADDEIPF